LQLVFARRWDERSDGGEGDSLDYQGSTQLVQERVKAPLKVQRPFYPEGPEVCHSVMLHTAGGVVGGDRLWIDLQLQPEAQALITTAAAGKVYRSNGQEAHQLVQVGVAAGACLEWLPQETIVFDQACYRQEMRIELEPGASWLGWEITRFGRTARGERFVAGEWRSHTEVWQEDRPLWIDRQWFPGSEELFTSPHGLAGCPVVGSFAFVGRSLERDFLTTIRANWAHPPTPSPRPHPNGLTSEIGVTRLSSGILCRYRGHSTVEARRYFLQVWRLLRVSLLGREVCIPRVW
jgi:urease accessory protein